MSYCINPVEEAKCAFLSHEGEMSLAETAVAQQEIGGLLAARRWNRIIVDVTATRSVPKAAEAFALGESLSRTLPRSARIALVVRPDQAKHARLIEQVARKGGAFLTFFINAEKAEVWVRGTPSLMHNPLFRAPQHPVTQEQKQL
jgi:hypothetical protein